MNTKKKYDSESVYRDSVEQIKLLGIDICSLSFYGVVTMDNEKHKELCLLVMATDPASKDARLEKLIEFGMQHSEFWRIASYAIQNPNLSINLLKKHMVTGRKAYFCNSIADRYNAFQRTSLHYFYEAGLQNPILWLIDLEQPGAKADFLADIDATAKQ